jgi:hypothetical protein
MDHINHIFTNAILSSSQKNIAIHAAIRVAKKMLNQYYLLTDSLELYQISMGLFAPYSYPLILVEPHMFDLSSPSSLSQVIIFQGSWLESRMDQYCEGPCL